MRGYDSHAIHPRPEGRGFLRLLIKITVGVCRDFAYRDKHLRGEIGQSAVVHTHTRRLDYHPHVHLVIPAGAVDSKRRLWRENKTGFLFSHKALATRMEGH